MVLQGSREVIAAVGTCAGYHFAATPLCSSHCTYRTVSRAYQVCLHKPSCEYTYRSKSAQEPAIARSSHNRTPRHSCAVRENEGPLPSLVTFLASKLLQWLSLQSNPVRKKRTWHARRTGGLRWLRSPPQACLHRVAPLAR